MCIGEFLSGLKGVRTSRMDSFLNLSPLRTHVSRKVTSVSEISAVNFMVGRQLFASFINVFISSLFTFHREKTSSIYLFQVSGFKCMRLMISVSTAAMKMLAKETAIFLPIAVTCV